MRIEIGVLLAVLTNGPVIAQEADGSGNADVPAKPQPATSAAAPAFDPAATIARCADLLVGMSEGEGDREWPYEGVYRVRDEDTKDAVIPVGYRIGGTAIVCIALVSAPGYTDEPSVARRDAVDRGVEFILEALDHPLMKPIRDDTYDVRGWGHIYALDLFVALERRGLVPQRHASAVKKRIPTLVKALEDTAIPSAGGWNYGNHRAPACFMTAPALQALFAAKQSGHAVSPAVVDSALDSLERGRAASGSIAYSTPGKSREDVEEEKLGFMDKLPGSIGRMVATEATLTLAGRGDPKRLSVAVESFFQHWDQLEVRRKKQGTHIRPYGVAPYYFMYAHVHAAQAIELLADEAERADARSRLDAILVKVQEDEGGWNDRVFPRSRAFGTAMGMLALMQRDAAPPARWATEPKKR